MAGTAVAPVSSDSPGLPTPPDLMSPDFWENELELNVEPLLRRLQAPAELTAWLASRTGRQLDVLCRVAQLSSHTKAKQKRTTLAACNGQLAPFYLTDHFARRKSSFAIADLAQAVLSPDVVALCRGADEETFDSKALLYALLDAHPDNLKKLFHLDKIHKSGFARMSLRQRVRQPGTTFEVFLTREKAQDVLHAFDRGRRDRRRSELKNIVRHNHHHLVFIRRPERQQYILRDGQIHHGHRVEWIILDFSPDARRVNIASESNEVPLEIANALASAFFEQPVEYVNECVITYEKQCSRPVARGGGSGSCMRSG